MDLLIRVFNPSYHEDKKGLHKKKSVEERPVCISEFGLDAQPVIGEIATDSVACGVLGVGGNKGAVAVSFSLYRRRFCALCSHFAAHQVPKAVPVF